MATLKVNVWQVGYTTCKDWIIGDKRKGKNRYMGYVEVDECDGWQDEAWHLLNWGCWAYDSEKGCYVKPDEVHSPLTHCNSDVILQVEGTSVYKCAKHCGWGTHKTLEYAIRAVKTGHHNLGPFSEVKGVGGHAKVEGDKVYYSKDGNVWYELTW